MVNERLARFEFPRSLPRSDRSPRGTIFSVLGAVGQPLRWLALAGLLAVGILGGSVTGASAGNLYWTNINNALPLSVGTSGLDGSNINNQFIFAPGNPYGLFVSEQYIYFTNYEWQTSGFGTIGRANLDGSNPNQTLINGASGPADVSVDDEFIYWANSGSNSIGRANLDGTGVNQNFITGTVNAATVWVNENYIYWGNGSFSGPSSIGRANLDGTGVNQNFITGGGVRSPATVVADQNYLFWTNSQGAPTIARADLDGSDVKGSFITAGPTGSLPNGLAVSGRFLYWTLFSSNTMGRARKDTSDLRPSFISPLSPSAGGPGSASVNQYLLSVGTAGSGSGAVTSSPAGIECTASSGDCAEGFPQDTVVTLTATPGDDSAFAGWGGACSGTGACVVTMDQARSVTATFNTLPSSFPLSVSKSGTGSGTVTSSPVGINCGTDCLQAFVPGTEVTLTATPSDSSSFAGWGGACSGTGPCTVTMSQARTVSAAFTQLDPPPASYTLTIDDRGTGLGTVTSSPAGLNCGSDCVQAFAAGSQVKLTAAPAPDSAFSGWGEACSGRGSCTVTMSQARKVSAEFVPTNKFRILKVTNRKNSLRTRVRTYDAGRLKQVGTRKTSSGRRVKVCSGSYRVKRAGKSTAACRLTASARKLHRKRAIRVRLKVTFRPDGGTPRTIVRSLRAARR